MYLFYGRSKVLYGIVFYLKSGNFISVGNTQQLEILYSTGINYILN